MLCTGLGGAADREGEAHAGGLDGQEGHPHARVHLEPVHQACRFSGGTLPSMQMWFTFFLHEATSTHGGS